MAASPRSNDESGPQLYRRPRFDVYSMLLLIALGMLILGTVVLWLVSADYDYKFKGGPNPGVGMIRVVKPCDCIVGLHPDCSSIV
jgi:hypothetical protein